LDAFLQVVNPDCDAAVFMLGDNGRDPEMLFPNVTVSGDGWRGTPLRIEGGRIIGEWKEGA
jgi:hypothetical protein